MLLLITALAATSRIGPVRTVPDPGNVDGDPIPMLSTSLWTDQSVQKTAHEALNNGFIGSLALATLPKEKFAGYVAQGKFYLDAFIKAYTLAIAKLPANDTNGIHALSEVVRESTKERKPLAAYALRWGVNTTTLSPTKQVQDYVDWLDSIATSDDHDVADILAAMIPCMRLYVYLGSSLSRSQRSKDNNVPSSAGQYQEWIDTYSGSEFEMETERIEDLFDNYTIGIAPKRILVLSQVYKKAMLFELKFIDSWNPMYRTPEERAAEAKAEWEAKEPERKKAANLAASAAASYASWLAKNPEYQEGGSEFESEEWRRRKGNAPDLRGTEHDHVMYKHLEDDDEVEPKRVLIRADGSVDKEP